MKVLNIAAVLMLSVGVSGAHAALTPTNCQYRLPDSRTVPSQANTNQRIALLMNGGMTSTAARAEVVRQNNAAGSTATN